MNVGGRPLQVRRLGRFPYGGAAELQRDLVARRRRGEIPDQLILLEHPHVVSLGTGAHLEHVLADASTMARMGIEMHRSDRGGDVTYHGPGQLVGYPILDLNPDRRDLHRYLRDLEEVLIRVAGDLGVEAGRAEGMTGVWTSRGKLAALGVRVSSGWITSHGFALNVTTDLSYFRTIVPCGIADREVTSLAELLGFAPDPEELSGRVVARFAEVFDRELEPRPD
jgi:lipoyl(octanoyl) transferase